MTSKLIRWFSRRTLAFNEYAGRRQRPVMGGWVGGSKEANILRLLPYLEQGWAAVNVQYRLGDVSLAPAAVEDSLCASQWVEANAEQFGFDP